MPREKSSEHASKKRKSSDPLGAAYDIEASCESIFGESGGLFVKRTVTFDNLKETVAEKKTNSQKSMNSVLCNLVRANEKYGSQSMKRMTRIQNEIKALQGKFKSHAEKESSSDLVKFINLAERDFKKEAQILEQSGETS